MAAYAARGDPGRDSLKQVVTNLFDAVRSSDQQHEAEARAKSLKDEFASTSLRLDTFAKSVADSTGVLAEQVPEDYARVMANQVNEFVRAAADQAKAKGSSEVAREMSEAGSEAASSRTKALKSLEAYLGSNPLPVVDRLVTVKLVDGGYQAHATYTCKGNVTYRFNLGTQSSKLLGSEFKLSRVKRKLNIPVGLGKTWIRKEQVPRYEKLEQYSLKSAEASSRHLIAEFFDEEARTAVRMSAAGQEGGGFTSVEFIDGTEVVNVTTDAGLNKFLDSTAVTAIMNSIWAELIQVEASRVALTEVTTGGRDILEKMECESLLRTVLTVMGPIYKGILDGSTERQPEGNEAEMSLSFVRERLSLLGESASQQVQSALAIDARGS
ncbi:MAG: hypothetical protein ACLQEQ_03940 [Nitrososphaerales archaeon]